MTDLMVNSLNFYKKSCNGKDSSNVRNRVVSLEYAHALAHRKGQGRIPAPVQEESTNNKKLKNENSDKKSLYPAIFFVKKAFTPSYFSTKKSLTKHAYSFGIL